MADENKKITKDSASGGEKLVRSFEDSLYGGSATSKAITKSLTPPPPPAPPTPAPKDSSKK